MPALAFGPGLNVEGALLRACDGPKQCGRGLRDAAGTARQGKEEKKEVVIANERVSEGKHITQGTDMENTTGLL